MLGRQGGRADQVALQGAAGLVGLEGEQPRAWALLGGQRLSYGGRELATATEPAVVVGP
ncbi:MAG: hypothetical protein HUU35_14150 [Armatimonadetes bacterium]|nr:hypothetical protein [Armatimonadota bacterium]